MASDDASVSSTVHSYISLQDEYGISFSSDDEGSDVQDARPHDVDDDDDGDDDEHVALQPHHPYNSSLSRLSVCTTNSSTQELVDQDDGNSVDHEHPHDIMTMIMSSQFKSRLSLENLDISNDDDDAEHKLSDFKNSEEDKKEDCFSLPTTSPRAVKAMIKDYSSDNEVRKKKRITRRKNSHIHRWVMGEPSKRDDYVQQGNGGEDEKGGSSSTVGVLVTARPKGGRRSLCMGLEEVKACRDLGFELEQYQRIYTRSSNTIADLHGPSTSSSCASSPIPTSRISSPGDDPRDVKARLKLWAQAVALASSPCSSSASSHHGN